MELKHIQKDKSEEVYTLINFSLVTFINQGDSYIYVCFDNDNFIKCSGYKDVNDFINFNKLYFYP